MSVKKVDERKTLTVRLDLETYELLEELNEAYGNTYLDELQRKFFDWNVNHTLTTMINQIHADMHSKSNKKPAARDKKPADKVPTPVTAPTK